MNDITYETEVSECEIVRWPHKMKDMKLALEDIINRKSHGIPVDVFHMEEKEYSFTYRVFYRIVGGRKGKNYEQR